MYFFQLFTPKGFFHGLEKIQSFFINQYLRMNFETPFLFPIHIVILFRPWIRFIARHRRKRFYSCSKGYGVRSRVPGVNRIFRCNRFSTMRQIRGDFSINCRCIALSCARKKMFSLYNQPHHHEKMNAVRPAPPAKDFVLLTCGLRPVCRITFLWQGHFAQHTHSETRMVIMRLRQKNIF